MGRGSELTGIYREYQGNFAKKNRGPEISICWVRELAGNREFRKTKTGRNTTEFPPYRSEYILKQFSLLTDIEISRSHTGRVRKVNVPLRLQSYAPITVWMTSWDAFIRLLLWNRNPMLSQITQPCPSN